MELSVAFAPPRFQAASGDVVAGADISRRPVLGIAQHLDRDMDRTHLAGRTDDAQIGADVLAALAQPRQQLSRRGPILSMYGGQEAHGGGRECHRRLPEDGVARVRPFGSVAGEVMLEAADRRNLPFDNEFP